MLGDDNSEQQDRKAKAESLPAGSQDEPNSPKSQVACSHEDLDGCQVDTQGDVANQGVLDFEEARGGITDHHKW
ncbi:hypothetical protein [Lacticaseibacillus manihotivorans]|uniref:hypothetical protein n=1 Tax=Lacticaseibacillus manihotivorans TaxID=88233 RepID=UPI001FB3629D|nr:hypothetical protein [Lacticaseibacillus manihotivorans]